MRTGQRALMIAGLGLAVGLGASLGTNLFGSPAFAGSTRANSPAGMIATCDQFAVLQSMLASPTYLKAREARSAEAAKLSADLDAQMAELREEGAKIKDRNSPEGKQMAKELQTKGQLLGNQIRGKKAEADKLIEQGNLKELEEVYRLIIEASTTVAKREGYTYVMGSRSLPVSFVSQTLQGAFQEIYARPVMAGPEGMDITDLVFKELKVERTAPPTATPAAHAPAGEAPKPADK